MMLSPLIFGGMLKHNAFPYKIVPECSSLLKQVEGLPVIQEGKSWGYVVICISNSGICCRFVIPI